MTRRECSFFLIGLGAGLLFSVAAVIEMALWMHHMFIIGIRWGPASVVFLLPLLLIFIGSALLLREKFRPRSN
jgi:hypothetical protein